MATRSITDTPTLSLYYETETPLPAAVLAQILQSLSRSFEAYANRHRLRGVTLAVRRIETSSTLADLIAVGDAIKTLYDNRDLIAGFMTHIHHIIAVLSGLEPGQVRQIDRRAVQAISGPVAKGQATQLNINVNVEVHGDSNTINIGPGLAAKIEKQIEQDRIEKSTRPPPILRAPEGISSKKFGTAVNVKGKWHVRLEGDGGILRPADLGRGVTLKDEQAYMFQGYLDGPRYKIMHAEPIG